MLRRLPTMTLPLLAAFTVAVVAACSSGAAPGWTYAPVASTAAAASGGASGGPSGSPAASASAAASVTPSTAASPSSEATASATASGGGGGTALTVTAPQGAATSGFDPKELEASANSAFTVTFDNQDTTTSPHNWVLKDPSGAKVQVGGDTSFFSGPAKRDYQVPALAAGDYTFLCEVHPSVMTGKLTVK